MVVLGLGLEQGGVADEKSGEGEADEEDDDNDNDDDDAMIHGASDDLDSPYFDPEAHTSNHVYQSDIHTLLQVEETLALQVRTLDSTMQTLVYENYSKFIDATDAIRSIGVSVHANEQGLETLTRGMATIHDTSRSVEDALGNLRDAVAEKLRVKRLLTRLDALLKLPATLLQQKRNHRYRLATKSYLSAHAILTKHSEGFESLKSIELESHSIMEGMVKIIKHKLVHWSGNATTTSTTAAAATQPSLNDDHDDDDDDDDEQQQGAEKPTQDHDENHEDWAPPDPPETISDIFECAGTLLTLLPKSQSIANQHHNHQDGSRDESAILAEGRTTFDAGITASECKSMALEATILYLERVLDTHQIELQDAMFSTNFEDTTKTTDGGGFDARIAQPSLPKAETATGSNLIPTIYLDNMLEAATLFGVSFSPDGRPLALSGGDKLLLIDFVTEAYAGFLSHVKSILLEQSLKHGADDDENDGFAKTEEQQNMMMVEADIVADDDDDDDGDAAYTEISGAMTHLLRVVRDLASGLALPHVGVDVEFASSLVEQAVDVTETMVRRRVAQKFFALRLYVIQECLAPFARDAMAFPQQDDDSSSAATPRVVEIVQMASIALSDGLQLVDDTVKSILTGGVVVSDLKGVDFDMVKQAVKGCCRRFVRWLASTLEVLAGLESSSPRLTIQASETFEVAEEEKEDDEHQEHAAAPVAPTKRDDLSEMSNQQDAILEKVENSLTELLDELEESSNVAARRDFMLAISEMSRLAHRSVMENINQSINSSESGGGRKMHKNTDIFQSSSSTQKASLSEEDASAAYRFLLSASRTLSLYAMNSGSDAALLFCRGLVGVSELDGGEALPEGPRQEAWRVLEIAKRVSLDCATVFGGEKRAGPVPDAPGDDQDVFNTGAASSPSKGKPIKGLQLDVERMFTEKFPTYPHPSRPAEFTRSAVVTTTLQVAFNGMVEKTRTCTFTAAGYRQLQVDVAILRHFLPHYVKDDILGEGKNSETALENMLNDVLTNAGERCKDVGCVGQTKFYDPVTDTTTTLQSFVRAFMAIDDDNDNENKNVFGESEEGEAATEPKILPRFIIEDDKKE